MSKKYKKRKPGDWSPLYELIDCYEDKFQALCLELGYGPNECDLILAEIGKTQHDEDYERAAHKATAITRKPSRVRP